MSFVIPRPVAEWTVRIAAPLSLVFAASGLFDIITLPQPSDSAFYSEVAASAIHGTQAPRKDKTAAVTGFLKVMLGVGGVIPLILIQRELDATKAKLAKRDRPFELVERKYPDGEHAKGEDKAQKPRHKTEEFQAIVQPVVREVAEVVKENKWVQNLLACPVTICVGLGGTGKSRSAMAIAINKALFCLSNQVGVDTMVLDPQLEANQYAQTWVSGELYDLDSIPDTEEAVLRNKAGARHLITIFDEVAGWTRDYSLKDYMVNAIAHGGELARKTNQSHIFVCQELEDFGGKGTDKLFHSAEIIHFIPEPTDALGNTPRSKIVAIKKRNQKYSAYKPGNPDWTLHNVPADLDPSAFEQRIGQDLAELQMGAVQPERMQPQSNGHSKEAAIADFMN